MNEQSLNVQKAVQQADAIFYAVNPGGPSIKLNVIAYAG